jgi:hypothetical protein
MVGMHKSQGTCLNGDESLVRSRDGVLGCFSYAVTMETACEEKVDECKLHLSIRYTIYSRFTNRVRN